MQPHGVSYQNPQEHFREFGELLAVFGEEWDCSIAAGQSRLKFGRKRLQFNSSACGMPGLIAMQNAPESLNGKFQRDVTGQGPHTHDSYFDTVITNVVSSDQFRTQFPTDAASMRVTGMPALRSIPEKIKIFHESGNKRQFWHGHRMCGFISALRFRH